MKNRKPMKYTGGVLAIFLNLAVLSGCIVEEENPFDPDALAKEGVTLTLSSEKDEIYVSPWAQKEITLRCGESWETYQWYEDGVKIDGATGAEFRVPPFSDSGIRRYTCECGGASAPCTVAYTSLPVLYIDTVDGEEPTADYVRSEDNGGNYGAGLRNATKVPARMTIQQAGKVLYDSGRYLEKKSGLTLKLRGNTSAYGTKKPYKLKLQKKADLLSKILNRSDKSYRDKNWILLNDALSLRTFVGMKVSDIAGTPWTPEFAFVNVVVNGDYRGAYLLVEAVSRGERRADVAEDGFIIERDAYWWNEDVKFFTESNQKFTFKYPDDDEITDAQISFIKNYMNSVESHIREGTYGDYIDTESFARWILVHDILGIGDGAGSNLYMTKYDSTDDSDEKWSKISMSTPWDFDSIYMRNDDWSVWHIRDANSGVGLIFPILFASLNKAFLDSYKSQWRTLSPVLWTELSEKLDELNGTLGEDIDLSRKLNCARWGGTPCTVGDDIKTAENWFASRIPWLDAAIGGL